LTRWAAVSAGSEAMPQRMTSARNILGIDNPPEYQAVAHLAERCRLSKSSRDDRTTAPAAT
jgi:hypothetical protein